MASLVGGLAYMLGGPIASYASPGHDGKLFVSALLPLALWLLDAWHSRRPRCGRGERSRITVGLARAEPAPAAAPIPAAHVAARSRCSSRFGTDGDGVKLDRRTARTAPRASRSARWSSAWRSAPCSTCRCASTSRGRRAPAGMTTPLRRRIRFRSMEMFNLYLPQFTRDTGQVLGIERHSPAQRVHRRTGAVARVGGVRSAEARARFRRFWLGTGIVSLLWMLGGSTPFFKLIYELVPGTKFFRAPSTIIYVFAFSLSVFAALGTERVLALRSHAQARATPGSASARSVVLLGATGMLTGDGRKQGASDRSELAIAGVTTRASRRRLLIVRRSERRRTPARWRSARLAASSFSRWPRVALLAAR